MTRRFNSPLHLIFLPPATRVIFLIFLFTHSGFSQEKSSEAASASVDREAALHQFLEKVYQQMNEHYYLPVSRTTYEEFVRTHTVKALEELNEKTKQTPNFIHLGAGLLVNKLKSPSDAFTNFIPPDKTKEFKSKAYAVTEDVGIEGSKIPEGFQIDHVQIRSDAYIKGIRSGDRITMIQGQSITKKTEDQIRSMLTAPVGTFIRLTIWASATGQIQEFELEVNSYFRETVSRIPLSPPGALGLKIGHFNQMTSKDFSDILSSVGEDHIRHLVIDLRGNEGGPPLAARELLGTFLPPNEGLFCIARKNQKPIMLTSPLGTSFYDGPISILIDEKTGSAAELFSGIMQAKKKAHLIGQRSAGATFLKSVYDLEDGSAIFMITSLTYFDDKRVFPNEGLTPDRVLPAGQDALDFLIQNDLKKLLP